MVERHGDYGYDAPYALVTFAVLGAGGVIAAVVSWIQRGQLTTMMGFDGAFFLANAFSFLYTTRRADAWPLPTFARPRGTPRRSPRWARRESPAAGSGGASGTAIRPPGPRW